MNLPITVTAITLFGPKPITFFFHEGISRVESKQDHQKRRQKVLSVPSAV